MVSLLIQTELGLSDPFWQRKYPLAKVESLFSIRHENGAVEFFVNRLARQYLPKWCI